MMVKKHILLFFLLLFSLVAQAETLVLIQGYQAKGGDWRDSGVTGALTRSGWVNGGHIRLGARPVTPSAPHFYTVELTTDAPMMYQLEQLKSHIDNLTRDRSGESLTLVGHSAGGVLGRLFMVSYPEAGVGALITFSSPHLGTESAELGMMLGQSPLGMASRMLGRKHDLLGRSQGLFFDLSREQPGNLLFWLNRQEHPPARYISVVRDDRQFWMGDMVVPIWSQDMNQVYALRGRVMTIPSDGGHSITSEDGVLLLRILNNLRIS
ncbi:MAG: hypothetical protein GY703_15725 [Gammaproteobacteria bacterium]|nr:hypothetical protein [Gammaproteobacteria bacterium]